ncbi:hypothetical protein [Microvirga tunisiensis]|uniref:Uncharacterized protein n=1 Tax=Microvirga tunisiensis TaxID=2108360 RepID=A0A5N7MT39_9HYPH|nr:hypothetical protein [Microvirga tunisiensis]MPR12228.1 hypothetical protein [Microvirga tunisiensis]MPR30157.1 hypothetical protein [Microvirga tunisiensis]
MPTLIPPDESGNIESLFDSETSSTPASRWPRSQRVGEMVTRCVKIFRLHPNVHDAERTLIIRLSALVGDHDDPIIRALGALEARRVFTPETIVRLALQHMQQRLVSINGLIPTETIPDHPPNS